MFMGELFPNQNVDISKLELIGHCVFLLISNVSIQMFRFFYCLSVFCRYTARANLRMCAWVCSGLDSNHIAFAVNIRCIPSVCLLTRNRQQLFDARNQRSIFVMCSVMFLFQIKRSIWARVWAILVIQTPFQTNKNCKQHNVADVQFTHAQKTWISYVIVQRSRVMPIYRNS